MVRTGDAESRWRFGVDLKPGGSVGESPDWIRAQDLSRVKMAPMETSVSVGHVYDALNDFARSIREFTPTALLRNEAKSRAVLQVLGDTAQLADEGYRFQLAEDLVAAERLIVAAIFDPIRRRVGEAVLPSKPDFYGRPVGERVAVLSAEHITVDMYKDRRSGVLLDIAVGLAREFRGGSRRLPLLGIAGSYNDERLDVPARAFGEGLAEMRLRVASGYARPGQLIGGAMAEALSRKGMVIGSDRVVQYARTAKRRWHPEGMPGSLIVYGATQEEKRHEMLRDCTALVLFAGRAGTAREARIAESYRIPVIPLPFGGGAGLRYWEKGRAAVKTMMLGGHPVDPVLYAQLGHHHRDVAVQAALALVRQAITAVPVDSCEI